MKSITTTARELVWEIHEYTWTEEDFTDWQKYLSSSPDEHNKHVYRMVKDMTWDEIVTLFERGETIIHAYDYTFKNGHTIKTTIDLIEILKDAMIEDAWASDNISFGNTVDTEISFDVSKY